MRLSLPQPYVEIDHTADCGVEVEGASPEEVLARLVLAQSALLAGGEAVHVAREEHVVVRSAGGHAAAAVALLRELLYRFATERILPGACEVLSAGGGVGDEGVKVVVGFGPYDPELHGSGLDLKAVTLHGARFERADGGRWRAQVIFDI